MASEEVVPGLGWVTNHRPTLWFWQVDITLYCTALVRLLSHWQGAIANYNEYLHSALSQDRRENFLLQSQLCVFEFYSVSVPPRVTAVARKRPRPFCQKCRWQVTTKHAYSLDPTKSEKADYAAVQALCENLSGNKLIHDSLGNTRSQSSQLAESMWTDPGL